MANDTIAIAKASTQISARSDGLKVGACGTGSLKWDGTVLQISTWRHHEGIIIRHTVGLKIQLRKINVLFWNLADNLDAVGLLELHEIRDGGEQNNCDQLDRQRQAAAGK